MTTPLKSKPGVDPATLLRRPGQPALGELVADDVLRVDGVRAAAPDFTEDDASTAPLGRFRCGPLDEARALGRRGVVDGRAHDPFRGVAQRQGVDVGGDDECEQENSPPAC